MNLKALYLLLSALSLSATLYSPPAPADPLQLWQVHKQSHILGGPPTTVKNGSISQILDHTSVVDTRKFKQRYWITQTYTKDSNSPVFLYLCGESECGSGPLTFGPLPNFARETGGTILALEHRYYGKSQPFTDLASANLKFLSTEQAIEDIREFRRQMQSQRSLNGPWILVGGSYAGNLAAYTRRLYPTEFLGAISSSAPVKPEINFAAYDHYVASLAGQDCVANLQKALGEIEASTKTPEGYKKIQTLFTAQSVSRRDDFLYLLSDIASAALQLGFKSDFCTALKNEGVEGYRKMKLLIEQKNADYSLYTAEQSEDISLAKHGTGLGMRQWFYQSCQEYGYWQNAWPDIRESARSKEIDSRYHDELCRRLFSLPHAGSTNRIESRYYQPLLTTLSTNILFTRGTKDPWSALAVTSADQTLMGKGTYLREIQDAGHCEDLGMGGSTQIKDAKSLMSTAIKSWLQ